MTAYYIKAEDYALPSNFDGSLKRRIDIPHLIADGGLVDANGNPLSLPATGFAATDTLDVFRVPGGTFVRGMGVRPVTLEGAACTIDVGYPTATSVQTGVADPDGFLDDVNLNATTVEITAVADGAGANTLQGVVFITDGPIRIVFNSANTNAAVFDIFCFGVCRCW